MLADVRGLLAALQGAGVRFVVVGAAALVAHGSARATQDLDICYARGKADLPRLAAALAPIHPRLRGAPENLPFRLDTPTLERGLNFTLSTDLGDLDLLGEVTGLGGYDQISATAVSIPVFGHLLRVLDLDSLERGKRATGRLKDLPDIAEIAEIRRQRATLGEKAKDQ